MFTPDCHYFSLRTQTLIRRPAVASNSGSNFQSAVVSRGSDGNGVKDKVIHWSLVPEIATQYRFPTPAGRQAVRWIRTSVSRRDHCPQIIQRRSILMSQSLPEFDVATPSQLVAQPVHNTFSPGYAAKAVALSTTSTVQPRSSAARYSVRGSTSKVLASAKTIALEMYPLLGIRVRVKHISKIPSTLRNQASIEIHAAQ